MWGIMTVLSTPTDEWFVHDLRGPGATLDDDSVAEFRRSTGGANAKLWWAGAALVALAALLVLASGPAASPPPPAPTAAALVAAPAQEKDAYEADWEAAVEERDPAFVVERRVVPMEPRPHR